MFGKDCEHRQMEIGTKVFNIYGPIDIGEYPVECGACLEFCEVNKDPYGWYVAGLPILRRKTDHGVYVEDYNELSALLETSSFWMARIT